MRRSSLRPLLLLSVVLALSTPVVSSRAEETARRHLESGDTLGGETEVGSSDTTSAEPAESPVLIRATIDSASITVGSVAHLEVEVSYPPELTVGPVELPRDLGWLVLRDFEEYPPQETEAGDRLRRSVFALTAYVPGTARIAGPAVSYIGGEGVRGRATADSVYLTIASVLPPDSDSLALKDIRELAAIPGPGFPWRIAIVAAAAVAAAGALLFWLLRRRRRVRGQVGTGPPPKPPWEEARELLAALEQKRLPERGELERFYIELTAIIRHYLGARFSFPAIEMTTTEIVATLTSQEKKGALPRDMWENMRELLEGADLVKFARGRPALQVAHEDLKRAERLIDATEPLPPVAPESEPGAKAA